MPLLDREVGPTLIISWHVDAARARVWQCLTDPDVLGLWLGNVVAGSVSAGGDLVVDHGDGYCCRSSVRTCIEPRAVAFSWQFPDEPPSEVSMDLDEESGATRLRLTHRDLGDLGASYRDGWCVHLSYLEAAALGAPLPPVMFWNLHATVARLTAI